MFRLLTVLILLYYSCYDYSIAQNSYSLNTTRESVIFSSGIALSITDLLLINSNESITKEELNALSANNINSFDRAAAFNYSPESASWSDVLLYTTILSPLLMTTTAEVQNNIGPYLTMYFQNTITAFSVTHLTKAITGRFRPYTYNELAPDQKRMSADSRLSFFSGHATLSFASAVFLSVTFARYHPDSNMKPVVWGLSLVTASIVGYLRFAAGAHFPTDIITGAVLGSVIGYLIPLIHEHNKHENMSLMAKPTNNIFSITLQL